MTFPVSLGSERPEKLPVSTSIGRNRRNKRNRPSAYHRTPDPVPFTLILYVCPELERCLEELREEDTLVVWRLDRFGRSLKDLVSKMEALEEKGVDFVSLTEGIDTTTAQGKLTFHIFGALAEFERELSRERTMAGLKAARERGRVGGRPPALSEEEIPQVQLLMRNEEASTSDICERFDISRATLYRYVGPDAERRK